MRELRIQQGRDDCHYCLAGRCQHYFIEEAVWTKIRGPYSTGIAAKVEIQELEKLEQREAAAEAGLPWPPPALASRKAPDV